MNLKTPFKKALKFVVLFVICWHPSIFNAQQILIEDSKRTYFYASTAFVSSSSVNHETISPYYKISGRLPVHRTMRFDVGFNFMKNTALEIGYLGNWLDTATHLVLDEDSYLQNAVQSTRISLYSIVIRHQLNLYKNRLFLSPGLGYAIGRYTEISTSQFSEPETELLFDYTIITANRTEALTDQNGKFIVFKLGVEYSLFKRLSLFSNLFIYNGLVDLMERETLYEINEDKGSYQITSDGSAQGFEIGIRFNLR